MKIKLPLFVLLTVLSFSLSAFTCILKIDVTPIESKIYINGEYKGTGKFSYPVKDAKDVEVRVECEGYTSKTVFFTYKVEKETENRKRYVRGGNRINIDLVKESGNDKVKESNSDKTQLLTRIETLKSEGLITSDESLELKDKLLNDNGNEHVKAIEELISLRKFLNSSFITKEDFSIFKRKIVSKNYDYSSGNSGSDKLNALKVKSESGDYSKTEIDKLKILLVNSYK